MDLQQGKWAHPGDRSRCKRSQQYCYHTRFREVRDGTKYDHMLAFAESLPAIRKNVSDHLALRGLPREKVLSTVVHLLEATLIRVGSDEYVKQNKSYGLTTLKNRHVEVNGTELRFNFKGKSGKVWKLGIRDRRIRRFIRGRERQANSLRRR
jgi:DNA topoisomerase-1